VFKACADTKCTGAINGILRSPTYNWKLDFYNSSKGASVDFNVVMTESDSFDAFLQGFSHQLKSIL
jgi:hypothetical protein